MPQATEVSAAIICFFYHRQRLQVVRQSGREGMNVEFSKPAGERQMLLRRNFLIAEEDDQIFVERFTNFREGFVIERRRQIDAVNLRAKSSGDRRHLYPSIRHLLLLPFDSGIRYRAA